MSEDSGKPGSELVRNPSSELSELVSKARSVAEENAEAIHLACIEEGDEGYGALTLRQKRIGEAARKPKSEVPYYIIAAHEFQLAKVKAAQATNPRSLNINIGNYGVQLPVQASPVDEKVLEAWQCTGRCEQFFTTKRPDSMVCDTCEESMR